MSVLAVQLKLIWLVETAVTLRPAGTEGAVTSVLMVIVTTADVATLPAAS